MGISDRLLGKKNVKADRTSSPCPGSGAAWRRSAHRGHGIASAGFAPAAGALWRHRGHGGHQFGRIPGGSRSRGRDFRPHRGLDQRSLQQPAQIKVAVPIAENLHPVTNPALDAEGNIYVTFSGSRGQKVPVAIFKIDTNYAVKPFVAEMMNATAIAFDRQGQMYVSSRYDGTVYRAAPNGTMTSYAEGMGVATGIAFDREENLYVGDRSGTIFKIARDQQVFVFATLEPSVSAYHLAFSPQGDLFVTGPTTSSFDCVYRIDPQGNVHTFYRGLGRPQGLAFDAAGNLYVAASLSGKRGVVRITPEGKVNLEVSGQGLVGLAFAPGRSAILATTNAVHHLAWNVQGWPLLRE